MSVLGFLRGKPAHFDEETEAYRRLVERGYRPAFLIDVGAHKGAWTTEARKIFGDVPTLMVEPQAPDRARLEHLCQSLPGTRLAAHVLSDKPGETVTFYAMKEGARSGSSLKPERSDTPRTEIQLVTETLDRIADAPPNTFLKIDAQGSELDILRGGEETLQKCSAVQLEVPIMNYNEGAPTMAETLAFMDRRGFMPIDISGRTRLHGHLVQIDMIFAPANSPLRKDFFHFATAPRCKCGAVMEPGESFCPQCVEDWAAHSL